MGRAYYPSSGEIVARQTEAAKKVMATRVDTGTRLAWSSAVRDRGRIVDAAIDRLERALAGRTLTETQRARLQQILEGC